MCVFVSACEFVLHIYTECQFEFSVRCQNVDVYMHINLYCFCEYTTMYIQVHLCFAAYVSPMNYLQFVVQVWTQTLVDYGKSFASVSIFNPCAFNHALFMFVVLHQYICNNLSV